MKHRDRVLGLILVSPLCKAPSWSEWFYNKVITNLLYFYGMCGVVKEFLLQRYFSKVCYCCSILVAFLVILLFNLKNLFYLQQEVRGNVEIPESDIAQACRRVSSFTLFFFSTIHLDRSLCISNWHTIMLLVMISAAWREAKCKRNEVSWCHWSVKQQNL